MGNQYGRFYDEQCTNWNKNEEYNLQFLKAQERYLNDLLKVRGHVFLNEVYDALGINRTSQGQVVGWILKDKEDGSLIDFGIKEIDGKLFLNFNVQGIIYEMI